MQLLVVRHGNAGEPDFARWPDDRDRPLTDDGRKELKRLGKALAKAGVVPDAVVASPFLRAQQTAAALASAAGWPAARTEAELEPGGDASQLAALARAAGGDCVAVVGHEPFLSAAIAQLLGARPNSIDVAKAGVTCLRLEGRVGTLRWMLHPQLLGA